MEKEKTITCPMPQMQECIKEKCAWWDDIAGSCAILVIAQFGDVGSFYRQRQEQKESIARARIPFQKRGG